MKIANYLSLICFMTFSFSLSAQNLTLEGEVVVVKEAGLVEPAAGTMRWSGSDFQGWDGKEWLSLTLGYKVYDLDNNAYNPIKIGSQIWLGQNLRSTKYNDGTPIPIAHNVVEWANASSNLLPAVTWYNDDSLAHASKYGGLYNFYTIDTAINGDKNVCPIGFKVPNKSEMDSLVLYLGSSTVAGGKIKRSGTSTWSIPNTGATNSSGFSAEGGGRRGPSGTFASINSSGYLRTETPSAGPNAYYGLLSKSDSNLEVNSWNRGIGMSIRCIMIQ